MKKILLILYLLFLTHFLFAETMYVTTNGGTHVFDLSEILYVDFSYESIDDFEDLFSKIPIKLMQNYPNPFKPNHESTVIQFNLKKTGITEVSIYNVKGQKVRTLTRENMQIGDHSLQWNGKNENGKLVASGVYFYSVTQDEKQVTKKMIIMK